MDNSSLLSIDFHPQFCDAIRNKTKIATTRIIDKEATLQNIVNQYYKQQTSDNSQPYVVVRATFTTSLGIYSFALLHITNIEKCLVRDIPISVAIIEGYSSSSELIEVLEKFYPDLKRDDTVTIFYFDLSSITPDYISET